jgi:hypothetical protein
MIQSGDSRAVELFGIYNQYMPPFTDLSESDLQAIVSYIHANRQNLQSRWVSAKTVTVDQADTLGNRLFI